MKLNRIQMVLLAALDGLLIGLVLEGLRLMYAREQLDHELAEAASQGKSIGYILQPTANAFLPLLCIIVLAGVGYLVHKYFAHHARRLLLLWIVLGVLSLIAGYYMAPIGAARNWSGAWLLSFVAISTLVYYGWLRYPKSPIFLWPVVGTTALVVILAVTQAVGLFRVQRIELRDPLAWLLCLALVVAVNLLFGGVLSLVVRNYSWAES